MSDGEGGDRVVIPFPTQPRKKHIPTPETRKIVHRAAGLGLIREQIAQLLMIHPNTLDRHYKTELKTAEALLNFNVAQNLYSIATSDTHKSAASAAMFWMKTRAGWRETTRHEITGADGGQLVHSVVKSDTVEVRTLTHDEREALKMTLIEALAQQALPPPAGEETIDAEFEEVEDPEGGGEDED